jgi:TP901 family phage tail tape measure protein
MTDIMFDSTVGSNFSATLNQMLAEADQFSKQTDGLVGQIGRLNRVTVGLINNTTGLTGANKVATAQAAAYQEAMASIEASTKVTNQSFEELRTTTLELARSLPSGIGEAVHIIESLQKSGVTAEASIKKLSVTFADLGHANGLDGAALGKELLSLNRVFGNSQDQISGFGDSLTSLSKKYGASADSTLAFAKALAPVAAQAGLSEGAVIGLGTAAARLGEDGTAGATAINKVLLDLTRSVRDGTPEVREYARMLNVSADSLSQMFKTDPTDVVVRFTEAIKKGGPDAQRSLEALGFDATRTVRSLQALSSEGNLRQIIDDSAKSYGGGQTATAAETAIGGVNDQVGKLSESLSQTVAAAGTPFLTFLDQVLKAANAVSGAVAGIAQSKPVQALGGLGAIAGFAGGAAIQALGVVSSVALGRRVFNFGRRTTSGIDGVEGSGAKESFYRGQTEGSLRKDATLAERTAFFVGRQVPKTPIGQGFEVDANGETVRKNLYAPREQKDINLGRTLVGATKNTLGLGANVVEAAANFYARDFASADQNGRGPIRSIPNTPAGQVFGVARVKASERSDEAQKLRSQARETFKSDGLVDAGKVFSKSLGESAAATRTMIVGAKDATRAFLDTSESGSRAAKALGRVAFEATAYAGRELKGAARGLAGGLKGAGNFVADAAGGAPGVALGAATIATMLYARINSDRSATAEAGAKGASDIYGQLNEFAAAAGLGSKGLRAFAEQTSLSTTELSNQNKTLKQATTVTKEEADQATSPGYQRAFNGASKNVDSLTTQARLTLGVNAAPQAIARVLSDVQNQYNDYGLTSSVGKNLSSYNAQPINYGSAFKLSSGQSDYQSSLLGTLNGAQNTVVQGVVGQAGQSVANKTDMYGDQVSSLAKFAEAKRIYEEGRNEYKNGRNVEAGKTAAESLASVLGTKASVFDFSGKRSFEQELNRVQEKETNGVSGFLNKLGGLNPDSDFAFLQQYKNLPSGSNLANPNYVSGSGPSQIEKESIGVATAFKTVSQNVDKSGRDLTEALFGTAREARGGPKASVLAKDVSYAVNNPGDLKAQETAGRGIASRQLRQFGTPEMANLSLLAEQDKFGANSPQRGLLVRAQQQLQASATITQAGSSTYDNTQRQINVARQARAIGPLADQGLEQQRQQLIGGEAQGFATRLQMQKAFVMASRQLNLQMGRQDQDAARDRARANEDFARQQLNAEQDHARQRANAEADYKLSVKNSTEDYHTAVYRQTRDFNKSIARAEQDFNIQRQHAQRDFNKQMKRMVEDAAKDLYDPYKRIQAQQVWDAKSLLTNLKEQNDAITKQTSELAQAQQLGLSQKVIDQLRLSSPQNAQQLDRLLQDLKNDPSLVGQYNQTATARQDDASALVKNDANDTYRRSVEDFKQSQADAEAAFKKSIKQSKEDFKTSLADQDKEFKKSMARGDAAYKTSMDRNNTEFTISMSRAGDEFKRTMDRMAKDLQTARARALQDLGLFADDVTGGPKGILTAFNSAIGQFNTALTKIPAKIRPAMGANLKQMWIDAGTDMKKYLTDTLKPYGLDPSIFTNPHTPSPQVTPGGSEMSGHGRTTTDQHTNGVNAHAAGAIVRAPQVALIGEAGPEAVLPLNATGAKFISDMLVQYVGRIMMPETTTHVSTVTDTTRSSASMSVDRLRDEFKARSESIVQQRKFEDAFVRTERLYAQYLDRVESKSSKKSATAITERFGVVNTSTDNSSSVLRSLISNVDVSRSQSILRSLLTSSDVMRSFESRRTDDQRKREDSRTIVERSRENVFRTRVDASTDTRRMTDTQRLAERNVSRLDMTRVFEQALKSFVMTRFSDSVTSRAISRSFTDQYESVRRLLDVSSRASNTTTSSANVLNKLSEVLRRVDSSSMVDRRTDSLSRSSVTDTSVSRSTNVSRAVDLRKTSDVYKSSDVSRFIDALKTVDLSKTAEFVRSISVLTSTDRSKSVVSSVDNTKAMSQYMMTSVLKTVEQILRSSEFSKTVSAVTSDHKYTSGAIVSRRLDTMNSANTSNVSKVSSISDVTRMVDQLLTRTHNSSSVDVAKNSNVMRLIERVFMSKMVDTTKNDVLLRAVDLFVKRVDVFTTTNTRNTGFVFRSDDTRSSVNDRSSFVSRRDTNTQRTTDMFTSERRKQEDAYRSIERSRSSDKRSYTSSMVDRKFDEIIKRSEFASMRSHVDTVSSRMTSREMTRIEDARFVTEIVKRAVESLSRSSVTSTRNDSRTDVRSSVTSRVDPVSKSIAVERQQRDAFMASERAYVSTLRRTQDYSSRAQHIQGQQVRTQRAMEYASVITHNAYSYDQRTQITGPVTVQADDPNKMLRDLRKKVALSRLVQPARATKPTSW